MQAKRTVLQHVLFREVVHFVLHLLKCRSHLLLALQLRVQPHTLDLVMQTIFELQGLLNFGRKLFSELILQIHNVKFEDEQ